MRHPSASDDAQARRLATALSPSELPPVNILIVDDEPRNLTVLETILDDPGYHLVRVLSPDDALLALVNHDFALLILDVQMPGMNGFELAQIIKGRRKTAQIPIIFLTAHFNDDAHVLEGYGTGAVDYLQKPLNAPALRSKVAVFAELYRRGRELSMANQKLAQEVVQRTRVEEELRRWNAHLDKRIAERTSELDASNRHKDEFLATLAHELRNPLAPVRNAVSILQHSAIADASAIRATSVIERQVKVMARLIDDLMDVGRINQQRLELRLTEVSIQEVINLSVEANRPQIEELGHELVLFLPQAPLWIMADQVRLAQVFTNILANAAKYTERGGRIVLEAVADDGLVRVRIHDNGIGIAAENLERVFDMFSQVETALSRSRGGLGIGLSLTKKLVEMHGGSVKARSEGLGLGSEFEVALPIGTQIVTPSPDPLPESPPATRRLRTLIVDDNEDGAATMAAMLRLRGFRVELAFDGQAAVEAAEAFRPELVLLDIGLPKRNGYEVCRAIKAMPWASDVRIVAITGWGDATAKKAAMDAGFDRHFVKPLAESQLMRTIEELARQGSA